MDAGILPVKRLERAKRRLGEHFSEEARLEIARALLADALTLCNKSGFLEWWVTSDDPEVLETAQSHGLNTVKDSTGSLNGALEQAASVVMAARAESVTIIPSDVPLAYSGDLQDILDTGSTSEVVVVPSERDGGTNGLYLRPPNVLRPRFGAASLKGHIHLAERSGFRCSILVLPRLALDIDTIEDVDTFLRKELHSPSQTAEVLSRLRPHSEQPG
jgi:2-phospho-L-lactate/phosphoenolpyruvate guanylyltransferase